MRLAADRKPVTTNVGGERQRPYSPELRAIRPGDDNRRAWRIALAEAAMRAAAFPMSAVGAIGFHRLASVSSLSMFVKCSYLIIGVKADIY
jgi:hypothetical protein